MTAQGDLPVSWIDDPTLVPPGTRPPEVPDQREKRRAQFDRFNEREDAENIVDVLWHYVRNIPCYAAAEGDYWALSCMPDTHPSRLTAISLHTMEAIYIAKVDGGISEGHVIAGQDALLRRFGSWRKFHRAHPGVDRTESHYEDAGADQVRLSGKLPSIHRAIIDDRIGYAIRDLTLRVRDKGRTIQKHGHSPQLAERVLGDSPPSCCDAATS